MLQLELFTLMVDTLATRLESDGYFFTSYHSLLPDQIRYLWWGVVLVVTVVGPPEIHKTHLQQYHPEHTQSSLKPIKCHLIIGVKNICADLYVTKINNIS